MAPFDPHFNSDDACPPQIDHYYSNSRLGEAQIKRVEENAHEYRLSSKRSIQNIDCLGISPAARERSERSIHRFNAFRTQSLGHPDLSQPFGIDDVLRWLDTLRQTMRLGYDKPVPNGHTIIASFVDISTYLDFLHPQHRFTQHDINRFRHFYHGLVRDKLVVTGTWHARNSLPFQVVSRMLTMYLNHHLDTGTHSWDVVLAKVLVAPFRVVSDVVAEISLCPKGTRESFCAGSTSPL